MALNLQREALNELQRSIDKHSRNLIQVLRIFKQEITKQNKFDRALYIGLEGIEKHLQAGGHIDSTAIPFESGANELFKDLLRKNHVIYASFKTGDPPQELFVTRDSDKSIVQACFYEMKHRLGLMVGEMSKEDFFSKYGNTEVLTAGGLSRVEVEYFRGEINPKADYTITRDINDPNKYMIVYPTSKEGRDGKRINIAEMVEKAIDKTLFDLTGTEGRRNAEQVEALLNERDRFCNVVKNNVNKGRDVLIVDSIDPLKFISTNKDGTYSLHQINIDTTVGFMGRKTSSISETVSQIKPENLQSALSTLNKPVLMSLKDHGVVFGFDYAGKSKVDIENVVNNVEKLKAKIVLTPENKHFMANERLFYIHHPEYQNVHLVNSIPQNLIRQFNEYVKENNLHQTLTTDTAIAFTDTDKEKVMDWVNKNVYQEYVPSDATSASPFIEYEARFYHECRGKLNLSDFETMPEVQYVVDANNPNFLFKLTKDGCEVYDDKEKYLSIPQNLTRDKNGNIVRDKAYDEQIYILLSNMTNPIMLDVNEVEGKSKEEIAVAIEEHRPDFYRHPALDELRMAVAGGNIAEFQAIYKDDVQDLNDRQKETLDRITGYKNNRETIKMSKEDALTLDGLEETDSKSSKTMDMTYSW